MKNEIKCTKYFSGPLHVHRISDFSLPDLVGLLLLFNLLKSPDSISLR